MCLYGIRVLMNSNTTPWTLIEYVSTPISDGAILSDMAGLFHRTTPDALTQILQGGLKPGVQAKKFGSKMIQLAPHAPWDRARWQAQGRTDNRYSICLSFDRRALFEAEHPSIWRSMALL